MQKRGEELLLLSPFTFPDNFNRVGKSNVLALRNACDILHSNESRCTDMILYNTLRALHPYAVTYPQWYDFCLDKPKQVGIKADMLLEKVQPPLQTYFFLQGAVEVFYWTLHASINS